MKTASEIRSQFLEYFRDRDHEVVPSSSLVPANDPTLLFTNAGMVQFKDVFLGNEKRAYTRAVTSQRCVRAGGKHNDLENVGYTARHHTFFEMLGNFSFGDYFKREAINYAWEFLTKELGIPEERLWVTVFKDDDEAADIWLKEVGVSRDRFRRCDEKDNFWSMGDTGPCGPCSEIFYDHGEGISGGPPGSDEPEGDRYVEIWNLVFTQYDRNSVGKLNPIPDPSVDTGMGLERITAVMQGVHNNYDIDLFRHLIDALKQLAGKKKLEVTSSRVVADHIRSCAFLIADGVAPSNEGRGYVLRRIIRRAIRHGNKLGFKEPFFYKLVVALEAEMGEAYPELGRSRAYIEKVLLAEEQRFAETLEQGLKVLDEVIAGLKGDKIDGEAVFKLYDTYGFPVDLTADVAREKGLQVDMEGFHQAMAEQRQRARAASKFEAATSVNTDDKLVSEFSGYNRLQQKSTIIAIYQDGRKVQSMAQGDLGGVILLETPFYAQSGGQVGDKGELTGQGVFFEVEDTKKQGQSHVHLGILRAGSLKVGDVVTATVDGERRRHIMRNHSATHLLHAALRTVLGDHVVQKGSLVAPDRLRFDFSHPEPLTADEIRTIERLINRTILENSPTKIEIMPLEKALESGSMSLFGEKYDDVVRVLKIGGTFSNELCGGTHVEHAGDIGLFKIISEGGVASGIRRIEAVTGEGALDWVDQTQHSLDQITQVLKSDRDNVEARLLAQQEKLRKLEKEVEQYKARLASSAGDDMLDSAVDIDGIKVLACTLDGADAKTLRDTVDQLKNKLGTAALILAAVNDNKVNLVAGVTADSTGRIKAGDLVNFVARQVGGKGGGRPDLAQAGGNDPAALPAALSGVPDWVRQQLS
ncbi:MAG: alanine--tRNA ligase [Gammaproteobacteria bacterium]|nr:alanine--tRNA ligase [Gammaproteobacteria bacterium]NIN61850.1 alanine--tRNA ligase [Gammaproteobacteria bacterium]NIO63593.1 alanine--tRNA ligase [Gammaproteobacteria bacterium]NIP49394.1 alanine--tRNA ligase [Gammaproteobacteria bacterium]NIQ10618.1 alanine--tRNA ligase [Gammaproteobacteria bacterium]